MVRIGANRGCRKDWHKVLLIINVADCVEQPFPPDLIRSVDYPTFYRNVANYLEPVRAGCDSLEYHHNPEVSTDLIYTSQLVQIFDPTNCNPT